MVVPQIDDNVPRLGMSFVQAQHLLDVLYGPSLAKKCHDDTASVPVKLRLNKHLASCKVWLETSGRFELPDDVSQSSMMVPVHVAEHPEVTHQHGAKEARILGILGVRQESSSFIDGVEREDELDRRSSSSGVGLDGDGEVRLEGRGKGVDANESG